MQRLTVAGRLLITALILAAIYFGFKYIGGVDLLKKFSSKNNTEQTSDSPSLPSASSESTDQASSETTASTDTEATDEGGSRSTFNYTPPAPENGKLKGVVELGASGFNSFIITVDARKNWKLEKSEFGNSLVLENMATDQDIREGLKKYIAQMLNYGVAGRDIHFVVSSGAVKAENTQKIIRALKSLNYVVNTVTPEQEGRLALRSVLPKDFESNGFVVDIGSGNTKISWKEGGKTSALESYGAKYFQNGDDDTKVYNEVKEKAGQIPSGNRKTCFIIGGVPFELAKQVRNGKERYTVLNAPSAYKSGEAKTKAGVNIYKAIADGTNCNQFVFDWDANFTIGYLLTL
ncbi:hypothetical protein GCM10027347_40590 [Larkinella harenae]